MTLVEVKMEQNYLYNKFIVNCNGGSGMEMDEICNVEKGIFPITIKITFQFFISGLIQFAKGYHHD